MPTPILTTTHFTTTPLDLRRAGQLLRCGHLVAFPTETVYGLGANALDADAVANIFKAKKRPSDNPLIVHVHSVEALEKHGLVNSFCSTAKILAKAFWPGPLTMVLPLHPKSGVANEVTAGLSTIAVRIPGHETARELLRYADVPVAAPSANLSGRPSPTCAEHVLCDLGGDIAAVIEGCVCEVGVESTVVDLSDTSRPAILRLGKVTKEQLEAVCDMKFAVGGNCDTPRAPGMKYRHYAPRANVVLTEKNLVEAEIERYVKDGHKVGVIAGGDTKISAEWFRCGDGSAESFARDMYGGLRWFDGEGGPAVDVILVVPPANGGVGEAVLERLHKAAAGGSTRE